MEHISGSTVYSFMQFVFIVSPSQGLPKYNETEVMELAFISYQFFLKNKRSGTSLPASFST